MTRAKASPTQEIEESPTPLSTIREGRAVMSEEEEFTLLLALMMVEYVQKKYAVSRGEVRVVV